MASETHSIGIDRYLPHEFDTFLNLYVDLFYGREPLTTCIGFDKEQMIFITQHLYAGENNLLSQGLCWIARDRSQGDRPVGIIVCDDPVVAGELQVPENLTRQELERISVATGLLEEIGRPMKEMFELGEGSCLHVAAVGVAPEYGGMGIAKGLLQTALSEAGARGFRYAFAECTSPASRMLFEKGGFTRIHSVSVSTFEMHGRRPLPDCDLEIHLMQKVLIEGKDC
ncbi:MAG: GNAT family N-acetyltransferase [Methanocalculus sp. MSAO_Arc2]|uniref:GNAT family N-acetyltransferase n=1 Tax=Methanocalculus sp. MSAO_Arc2 TaxID=2293855 RepID=UPI000FEE1C41|nr:MAG: GNAT family N-acetyltransferase [Methanocalculus sp. MSAO_Arc2]